MSKDLNQCNFIGRLGKDPEIRYTPTGSAVANLSLACGDDYKDKQGQKVEQTNWIRVVAFGKLADIIAKYVKKADPVYISGKQVTRKWQDKDGQDRYTTEIVANEILMLGGRQDTAPKSQPAASQQASAPQSGIDDFDETGIPF